MSHKRAYELQRRITRSLGDPNIDPWVARELRRANRRLARIIKAEQRVGARS